MKPQILDMDSEALEEFRERFNLAISSLIRNMVKKDLGAGVVAGKIKIEIDRTVDKDTGEVILMPKLTPDVSMKVDAKGKIECSQVTGMILQTTPCGQPVVASNQITMDELIEADRKGA